MTDTQPMQVDVALVRELAHLLDETNLTEIEVEEAGRRIRVARTAPAPAPPVYSAAPAPAPPSSATPTPAAAQADDLSGAIRSPIVGTAYLTPEPGQPPFVTEGQMVAEGDTLVIIEAMKVMNPIPAPRAGRVTRVMIANAAPVEFDQPLMIIA